jgi:myotubularin-related protein 6/7/8
MLQNKTNQETKEYFHTYPSRVFIPTKIKDKELAQCSLFRSRQRFPALSYFHQPSGTSVWRCSQNLTGVFSKRDEFDEKMLKLIGETNPHSDEVLILDARSSVNAQCNRLIGGGFEQISYYTN